ncbi:histone-lysine N-methyltransferase SUVR4 isoform X2 [Rhodamnia argentea]|uniref:Histone-lysine N-methyltransferase SUVR4 isoform X2 n=1 Tax=Rhodamnia argentea TaxID=178133 RepID=A0A8B8MLS9_9MYRT|nr:histone-lysine N-methyltransferase SUVR4 isoform X2 [Rhodamnia argentea]XP_048126970.1 histone-lysine N-methyltransferase SUVR4 isoform X2 [Rhodamnia argentea]XP_048126976.1 histone-lysine N-methyltransferase SUVR4 isoform X2 [Rhodamnia argentea]
MAPDVKVRQAFAATRALGIPDEENIGDGNGSTAGQDGCERPSKRLHLEKQENQVFVGMKNIASGDHELSTSSDRIVESPQRSFRDGTNHNSRLLHVQHSNTTKQTSSCHSLIKSEVMASRKQAIGDVGLGQTSIEGLPGKIRKKELSRAKTCSVATLPPMIEPTRLGHSEQYSPSDGTQTRFLKSATSSHADMEDKDDCPLSNDLSSCRGHINIASSPLGEVKLSLDCKQALAQRKFERPKLGAVLKFVEDKYLQSFEVVGSQFSVIKLLKDICESYLDLGCNPFERSGMTKSSPDIIGSVSNSNGIAGQNTKALSYSRKDSEISNSIASTSSSGPVNARRRHCSSVRKSRYSDLTDITKGAEKVKISLADDLGNEQLPAFNYIPHNIIYQSAHVQISLARIADDDCCSSCIGDCLSSKLPCACARETGGEFAYTPVGQLKEEFLESCKSTKVSPQAKDFVYCQDCPIERSRNESRPEKCKGHLIRKFIKECWRKCGCGMHCGNRVVQRGITCKLQVFLTEEGKGWGVRTLEELPKGTFVCEYVGEIVTNTELYDRNMQKNGRERHTYPVMLDADWGSEGHLLDEEALCLDATYHGNVARFVNHRCFDANLIDIPVEVETPDRHYYHLAFFTTRKVGAFEELNWDYGIDFDDLHHPVKAFKCCCKSSHCRDMKRRK